MRKGFVGYSLLKKDNSFANYILSSVSLNLVYIRNHVRYSYVFALIVFLLGLTLVINAVILNKFCKASMVRSEHVFFKHIDYYFKAGQALLSWKSLTYLCLCRCFCVAWVHLLPLAFQVIFCGLFSVNHAGFPFYIWIDKLFHKQAVMIYPSKAWLNWLTCFPK